jgi:hypothetical protein
MQLAHRKFEMLWSVAGLDIIRMDGSAQVTEAAAHPSLFF